MNVRLLLVGLWLPAGVRRKKLRELFEATARAFGAETPPLEGLSVGALLERYAAFTREEADRALRSGGGGTGGTGGAGGADGRGAEAVEKRLFAAAFDLGTELRRLLRVSTRKEAMAAARVVYRLIGIDFRGRESGEVEVASCGFSRAYAAETCRLVSALDRGLLSGLSGAPGELEFTARITDGDARCRAAFRFGGGGR